MSEAAREFLGVESIIETMRISRRSEEVSRAHVTFSIPVSDRNRELIGGLAMQLKNRVFFGVGFMQDALDFPTADDPASAPPAAVTTMAVDGQDGQEVERPWSGAVRHLFRVSDDHETCLYCGKAKSDQEAHLPDADNQPGEFTIPNALVDRLIADAAPEEEATEIEQAEVPVELITEEPAPATEEEASEEQKEGRQALAHRSRNR